jgi:hypothetical protein
MRSKKTIFAAHLISESKKIIRKNIISQRSKMMMVHNLIAM